MTSAAPSTTSPAAQTRSWPTAKTCWRSRYCAFCHYIRNTYILHVHMYVCMYCSYVLMLICLYGSMCLIQCLYLNVFLCKCMHCMYVCMYVCIYVLYVCTVCMYVCMYLTVCMCERVCVQHSLQQTVDMLKVTLEPFNGIEDIARSLGIPMDASRQDGSRC